MATTNGDNYDPAAVEQIVEQQPKQMIELRVPLLSLPTYVEVTNMRAPDGQLMVILQIHTPTGIHATVYPADAARKIGQDMIANGTGIQIAHGLN